MLPPATATELNALGHDAVSVIEAGLAGTTDELLYRFAVAQSRVIVTENFADFAALADERVARQETTIPVVFVRKRSFPGGRALASHLARHLHGWAQENPDPFPGVHWPEPG